jgi:hypothetical protein
MDAWRLARYRPVAMSQALRLLVVASSLLSVATPARAEEFSWEVSGAASRTERDPFFDTDRSAIAATRHFGGGVEDGKGPLALASFLSPSSFVSAAVSQEKVELHPIDVSFDPPSSPVPPIPLPPITPPPGIVASIPSDFAAETDLYQIGGRYVLSRARPVWYFGGDYTAGDAEPPLQTLITEQELDAYRLFAGRYFGARTSLDVALDRSESRTEGTGIACVVNAFCAAIIPQSSRTKRDTASVDVLHVRTFRSLTYSLSARIAQTSGEIVLESGSFELPLPSAPFPTIGIPVPPGVVIRPLPSVAVPARTTAISLDRFNVYSFGGELFPTPKLGVRLGYMRWDGAPAQDDAYDVATTWFVTRNVGLRFSMSRQRADEAVNSEFRYTDAAAVQVLGRF